MGQLISHKSSTDTKRSSPSNAKRSPSSSGHPSYIAQVREWIDACNLSHCGICVPKPVSEQPYDDVPLWLIDTNEQCIVHGNSAHRYLALSYTWPEPQGSSAPVSPSLILDTATVADLRTPGCLSRATIARTIPNVIRHAMRVTAALGERYLWVDRLCIIQNNQATQDQVAKMDKIYGGAYLTIIAAAPDDMYRDGQLSEWPRFNPLDEPLHGCPSSSGITQDNVVRIMDLRYKALSETRWATRGWTYQEQILCKRAVIFTKKGILWDCQCCMWDGAVLHPEQDSKTGPMCVDMGRRFSIRWWPDFGFYIDLICPYNGREFTYPQDGLLGMSGVLNALSRSFPGRFVSGIPSMFLDYVLLWQPSKSAKRRRDRDKRTGVHRNVSSLPSWSWCGWRCLVDPLSLRSGLAYIDEQKNRERALSWRTRNLVEWRMSNNRVQFDLLPEPTVFDKHVELLGLSSVLLPEGWHAYEILGTDSMRYNHTTDPEVHFKHPIPLELNTPRQQKLCTASYLVFKTNTAKFLPTVILSPERPREGTILTGPMKVSAFEGPMFDPDPRKDSICPIMVLRQPNGMFAGLLRLMNCDSIRIKRPFELIAISTGSAKAKDFKNLLEWNIFAEGEAHWSAEDENRIVPFQSSRLHTKQKRSLLFDLAMAFHQNAAKEDSLAPELEAIMAKMDSYVKSEVTKDCGKSAKFYKWYYGESFEQRVWFKARAKVLEQHRQSKPDLPEIADDAVCHFYNVLWIQRKDGIAYRKACGWVPKYIWEAHAKGPVDITLG